MTHLVSLGRRPGMPELYDKECFPLPISWTTSTGWTLLISTEEGITWLGCFMLLGRVPGFPGSSVVKNLLANAGYKGDVGSNSWVRKIPWRRKWQPNPVFLPGNPHGQRSLVGYSPWSHKESDITEHTHTEYQKIQVLYGCLPLGRRLGILEPGSSSASQWRDKRHFVQEWISYIKGF